MIANGHQSFLLANRPKVTRRHGRIGWSLSCETAQFESMGDRAGGGFNWIH